jgi:hypothetical protein
MDFLYSICASIFVGLHLFSLKLLSEFPNKFYEIFTFMILTLLISRFLIYLAMSATQNATTVHIILNLSVFVTLFSSIYVFNLTNFNLKRYMIGLSLVVAGLYFVQTSLV